MNMFKYCFSDFMCNLIRLFFQPHSHVQQFYRKCFHTGHLYITHGNIYSAHKHASHSHIHHKSCSYCYHPCTHHIHNHCHHLQYAPTPSFHTPCPHSPTHDTPDVSMNQTYILSDNNDGTFSLTVT